MIDLTLYNIMAEDHVLTVKLAYHSNRLQGVNRPPPKPCHISVEVEDEQGEKVYDQISHIYAWESLVGFAKQVLNCDKKIQEELERLEP